MKGKSIEIMINGAIIIREKIDKLECYEKDNLIVLAEANTSEFVIIDINEAYCTKEDKQKNKLQVNIDTMNKDTVITIKSK